MDWRGSEMCKPPQACLLIHQTRHRILENNFVSQSSCFIKADIKDFYMDSARNTCVASCVAALAGAPSLAI